MEIFQALMGTWQLREYRWHLSEGGVVYPAGHRPVGYLFYQDTGYMAVQINAQEPGAEQPHLAYCGTFEIFEEEKIVLHQILCSYIPSWTNTTQVRHFRLDGDVLHLTRTAWPRASGTATSLLTWERAGTG